jgi:CDP-glycerol glycerophosphotransferase
VPYAIKDAEMLNYLISNSSFETEVYKRNFWNKGNILELGHPRNDIFFIDNTVIKQKIKERYSIDEDKKILFYVPSFRDNETLSAYGLEYKELKKVLDEKFGGDWLILVRLHPNLVKFQQQLLPQRPYILNVTDYPDIQELLVAADAAITDYSSCIFDFMLSRKPAFIYASDVDDFDEERGFYYPLTATPFPVAENNEQLRQNILNFDLENYQERVEKF